MKRLQKAKLPLSLLFAALAMVCVAALAPSQANAATYTLISGSSTINIDSTGSTAGVNDWIVNGNDYLKTEWFYYSLGGGVVAPINSLGSPTVSQPTTDQLILTYALGNLSIALKLSLTGATASLSDLSEIITVVNTTGQTLQLFEYTNFNLRPGGDYGVLENSSLVKQYSPPLFVSETSANAIPTSYEIGVAGTVLTDVMNNTLTNTPGVGVPTAQGDIAWTFEWTFDGDKVISKDKGLNVPLPASALLLGTGLLGLVGLGYRRSRKS